MFHVASTIVAYALLAADPGNSADGELAWDPVQFVGVDAVNLVVNEIPEEFQRVGITKARLEAVAELRLRSAGVPVSTPGNRRGAFNGLVVDLGGRKSKSAPMLGYSVRVLFGRFLQLRQSEIGAYVGRTNLFATTGSMSSTGIAGVDAAERAVIEGVEEMIDSFALAFLRARPTPVPRVQ